MTDLELLQMAAKAAGIEVHRGNMPHQRDMLFLSDGGEFSPQWNPLDSDGDALRLAVKLRISIDQNDCDCCVWAYPRDTNDDSVADADMLITERMHFAGSDDELQDRFAATRRAIVRAAAELGRAK